jgi:phage/plasmid primase-like uncharacterized protein
LVVGEGIETTLSLALGLIIEPATYFAALSAGGMRALSLPRQTGKLIIAADGDPVGQAAAKDLATRAYRLGWTVHLMPAPAGQDWNDVLKSQETSAA